MFHVYINAERQAREFATLEEAVAVVTELLGPAAGKYEVLRGQQVVYHVDWLGTEPEGPSLLDQ